MHASGPGDQTVTCSGRTPGYWKQDHHFDEWPAPYVPETQPGIGGLAASLFHQVGFNGGQFGSMTLLQVLELNGNEGGYGALGRHIGAALLNAASGKTPVLDVPAVLNIWNEYVAGGYFEPTAGVKWGEEQIVAYLTTTMPI